MKEIWILLKLLGQKKRKILCVMKLSVFFVLFFSLSVSARVAAQQEKVNLHLENVSLKTFFREVQKQTGLYFVYNEEICGDFGNVSIAAKDEAVVDVLETVFANKSYSYHFEDKIIVVKTKTLASPQQQMKKVKGKVTDGKGNPLPGVGILIEGTTVGTTTDVDGNYVINCPEKENLALIFSFVGMKTHREVVGSRNEISVKMVEEVAEMDEVVVTGYQDIKKERMTGSTTTINVYELRNKGLMSVDEILSGTVSGLSSISSGRPGEDAKIMIRGVNSLTGSTDPIWIVDGMPLQGEIPNIEVGGASLQTTIFTSGIGNIAPDDIESITILKDAAATAIYGARAANGVIVVKTKSGTVGKTHFSATANYGIKERPVNNIDMMNTRQKIQFEREAYADDAGGYLGITSGRVIGLLYKVDHGELSKDEADKEIERLSNIETDWFRELFRRATTGQYHFSLSGGSEQTQHYASINYLHEKGTVPNNKMNRLNMNVKLTHTPVRQLHITGGLAATIKNDRISASKIDPLSYALYANPYERPYKEDGTYDFDLSYDVSESSIRDGFKWEKFNIVDDLNRNTNTSRYLNAEFNLKIEWEIIPGLTFSTQGVYNANSNHNRITEGAGTYTNFVNNWYSHARELPHEMVKGSLREATGYSNSYTFRNTLQYSSNFKEKHFITIFAGQEISSRKGYNSYNYSPIYDEEHRVVGFPDMKGVNGENINYTSLGGTGKSVSKLSSFFANASYSYMDRYIITGAIRYDGSDIIGNNNQFTPLWNVGVRWNLHREKFMESSSFINELSLKTGFGYTGSIDKNALPFVVLTMGQSIQYDGIDIPTKFTYPNPNVKWQTKQDFNVGFTIALWNRKVNLDVNFYNNKTQDVLDNKALAASSGRSNVVENVANIINRGWEIDLGLTLWQTSNIQWNAKFNAAFNHNELKDTYYKSADELPLLTKSKSNAFVENYPVGGWFGFHFAGIEPINGNALIHMPDGSTYDAENLRNTTLNGAKPVMSYLGKKHPSAIGGFSTTLTVKRFVLSTSFDFKAGHKIPSFNTFREMDSRNRHINDINRWRQAGDITKIPAASTLNNAYSRYMYDVMLEKGDYLRCSFLSLGYNIDAELLNKIGVNNARLSFTVKDLFTLTKYKGIDPALMGGFGYPNSRQYTISLNLGF